MLSVLLNVGTASSNLLPIGSTQHNMGGHGKGMGFYTDRAGGCHSQYLGVIKDKIDTSHSHRTFKRATSIVASGNRLDIMLGGFSAIELNSEIRGLPVLGRNENCVPYVGLDF